MKTSKRITRDAELKIAFSIREEVFVKEQGVPLADEFDEFDSLDADCEHVLVYYHEEPVGTGRIRMVKIACFNGPCLSTRMTELNESSIWS